MSVHVSPVYLVAGGVGKPRALIRSKREPLHVGDEFRLLPNSYCFRLCTTKGPISAGSGVTISGDDADLTTLEVRSLPVAREDDDQCRPVPGAEPGSRPLSPGRETLSTDYRLSTEITSSNDGPVAEKTCANDDPPDVRTSVAGLTTTIVTGGNTAGTGGTTAVTGDTTAVTGGTTVITGGITAVTGGTTVVTGGTTGGTTAVTGGTTAVTGGTTAVTGSTTGGTTAVTGGTTAVTGGTTAVTGSTTNADRWDGAAAPGSHGTVASRDLSMTSADGGYTTSPSTTTKPPAGGTMLQSVDSVTEQRAPSKAAMRKVRCLPAWMLQPSTATAAVSGDSQAKRPAHSVSGDSQAKRPAYSLPAGRQNKVKSSGSEACGVSGRTKEKRQQNGTASPRQRVAERHRMSPSDSDGSPEPAAGPQPAAAGDPATADGPAVAARSAEAYPLSPVGDDCATSPAVLPVAMTAGAAPPRQALVGGDTATAAASCSVPSARQVAAPGGAACHVLSDDCSDGDGSGAAPGQSRESCCFGAQCFRTNPAHRRELAHPGDADFASPPHPNAAGRQPPECQFGLNCYRKNPQHRKMFCHTSRPNPMREAKRKARRKAQQPTDTPDSYDEEFINDSDSDSDDYAPVDTTDSDWAGSGSGSDDDDRRRLIKEARRLTGR